MHPTKRVLGYRQLKPEKGIPWTRQYIRRLERQGRFPHHIRVGAATIGWLEHELDAWLEARTRERDAGLAA